MPQIHSPLVFGTASALLLAYVVYMILRRRRGERSGTAEHEPEL